MFYRINSSVPTLRTTVSQPGQNVRNKTNQFEDLIKQANEEQKDRPLVSIRTTIPRMRLRTQTDSDSPSPSYISAKSSSSQLPELCYLSSSDDSGEEVEFPLEKQEFQRERRQLLHTETPHILLRSTLKPADSFIIDPEMNIKLQQLDELTYKIKANKKNPQKVIMLRKHGETELRLEDLKSKYHGGSSREAFKEYFRVVQTCLDKRMTHYNRQSDYLLSVLKSPTEATAYQTEETERVSLSRFIEAFLECQWAQRVMRKDPKLLAGAIRYLFSIQLAEQYKSLQTSLQFISCNNVHLIELMNFVSKKQNLFILASRRENNQRLANAAVSEKLLNYPNKEQLAIFTGLHPDSLDNKEWKENMLDILRKQTSFYVENGHAYSFQSNRDLLTKSLTEIRDCYEEFQKNPLSYKSFGDGRELNDKPGNKLEHNRFYESKNLEIIKAHQCGDAVTLYSSFVQKNDGIRNMHSSNFQAWLNALIERCIKLKKIEDPSQIDKLNKLEKDWKKCMEPADFIKLNWKDITKLVEKISKIVNEKKHA